MSGLLLDTCSFVWLVAEPETLSGAARDVLDDPDRALVVSDVSVWEICLKWEAGKLDFPTPPRVWVAEQMQAWSFEPLAIERSHMLRSTELPRLHRDPFDRLLIAQALELGLTIVSPDAHIRAYPVATCW